MEYSFGQKIKLTKDHSGKALKTPKYGYVALIADEKNISDPLHTEAGPRLKGNIYLIQTSSTGGGLWYTEAALKPAKGKNEFAQWQKKIADYHVKHGT